MIDLKENSQTLIKSCASQGMLKRIIKDCLKTSPKLIRNTRIQQGQPMPK